MKDESITIRIPSHVKARLARYGSVSDTIRTAINEWIARQDRELKRARNVLADAGIFDAVWARLRMTGPSTMPAREWAAEGFILIADDTIADAVATVIRNGH